MKHEKSAILAALKNAAASEVAAVIFLEQQRWGNSPLCARCESADVYRMVGRDGARNADFRWRCRGCRRMYTVRTNTVFEETRLPLRIWVHAFWRACASKKGISALQLKRETEISYKSALFVLRRLRHGMGEDDRKLTGTVEVDEVYIGGKPRKRYATKRGRGTSRIPVVGMVERGGDVRFRMMDRLTQDRLREVLAENADLTCRVITDDFSGYKKAGQIFEGGHEVVRHVDGEYVRRGTDVHSNTIEGVFSLIRRGVMGTFHSISRKHLPNYLNEFSFRWNTRKMNDGERVSRAIQAVAGKRLEYRESVDYPPYLAPPVGEQPSAPFEE
jgi:transposase-like protein